MTRKPITIKSISKLKKIQTPSLPEEIADKWVNETTQKNNEISSIKEKKVEETRFTIVIPSYLHRRIKKYCANNAISMKDQLTQVFIDNFPET